MRESSLGRAATARTQLRRVAILQDDARRAAANFPPITRLDAFSRAALAAVARLVSAIADRRQREEREEEAGKGNERSQRGRAGAALREGRDSRRICRAGFDVSRVSEHEMRGKREAPRETDATLRWH